MTLDRKRITEKISEFKIGPELRGAKSFLAADWSILTNGEKLNRFLQSMEAELQGLDPRKIHAAKNIVLELAGNTFLHGAKDGTGQELLFVIRRGGVVSVWMFGAGRKSQIERLAVIIDRIGEIERIVEVADGSSHGEELLKWRNTELVRESNSPVSKERGAGVGLLTIAALSSEPLWFRPKYVGHEASFALRSIV
jgi:hypothetical protein